MKPQITNIKRHNGVAGQIAYTATVQYPDEEASQIEFVGSVYGGGVVMVMGNGAQVPVRFSGRFTAFGTLNPQWVRDFFEEV